MRLLHQLFHLMALSILISAAYKRSKGTTDSGSQDRDSQSRPREILPSFYERPAAGLVELISRVALIKCKIIRRPLQLRNDWVGRKGTSPPSIAMANQTPGHRPSRLSHKQ